MAKKHMYELFPDQVSIAKYFSKPEVVTAINAGISGTVTATAANVTVTAGTGGLAAGSVQAALQSLATRVTALENA